MNTITSKIFISAATVLWAASVQGAAPRTPQTCVIEEIQIPAKTFATPISINRKGDIAGTVGDTIVPWASYGFLQRNSETINLPLNTIVNDANAAGMLVGNTMDLDAPYNQTDTAFKWVNGKLTMLPKLRADGLSWAYAHGINDHGLIVGRCTTGPNSACYWEGDHLKAFPLEGFDDSGALAVNNAGVIVGTGQQYNNPVKCAKWVAGKPSVLPSGDSVACIASTINNRGEIAGRISEDGQGYRAVMWRGDVMSYLGGESDYHLRVHDISDSGVVVGSGLAGALYWRNGKQYRLNDLGCVQQSGWNLVTANSISPAGIVGVAFKRDGVVVGYRLRRAFND
jgi:uncharacterized membrane protein